VAFNADTPRDPGILKTFDALQALYIEYTDATFKTKKV